MSSPREMPNLRWLIDPKDGALAPFVIQPSGRKLRAAWAPQPGSQEAFLACPIYEVLYEGTRGPGKTDALIMDFAQEIGKGWGADWRGVLFRRTFPELEDVINKLKKWIPLIWPQAKYNNTTHTWTWPDGEALLLRHFRVPADYWSYHGHAYPWIAWEELVTWPTPDCYLSMFSCSRSTRVGMPRKIRATCNPYGVGHNWVKMRWKLPIPPGRFVGDVIRDSVNSKGELDPPRVAIHGHLYENKVLLHADPDYIVRLRAAAKNESQLKAWVDGDWNIVAGGMFDDVWDPATHFITPFKIPDSWKIDRAFDWGSSRPFSVGWWAESDGCDVRLPNGRWRSTVRGDLFRVQEWYGCKKDEPNTGLNLTATEIAKGIVEREEKWGWKGRVRPGPAGGDIFSDTNGSSIEKQMKKCGIIWRHADNRSGSRINGWEAMRTRFKAALQSPREDPGVFIFDVCHEFKRTVPVLVRDDDNLDDVDSDSEDHIGDESRYRIAVPRRGGSSGKTKGLV